MKTMLVAAAILLLVAGATEALGQTTDAVERAQQALKQAGHDPGPIDGVVGSQTAAALKAYQKAHGLNATGRLDDATAAKLGEPAKRSSSSEQSGGDTRPSAVDPAQGSNTGANVGEGASYSRSTEKGASTK